jgi:transketolase
MAWAADEEIEPMELTPMKATEVLHNLGQSLWLDNITRDLLNSGTLERYIEVSRPAGRVIGMKTFGASAPLKELQRHFGVDMLASLPGMASTKRPDSREIR